MSQKRHLLAFTIVELLVVIVVIGILAAITIVSYSNISLKAVTVSLESDLNSGSKLLKLYNVDHDYYPNSIDSNYCPNSPVADSRYCLKTSGGNSFTYSGGNQSFTLTATNINGLSYSINENGLIEKTSDVGGGSGSSNGYANVWDAEAPEFASSISATSDNGYVVVGSTNSYGIGSSLAFISKYNSNGSISWTKAWGNTTSPYSGSHAEAVVQSADGGYLVTGQTYVGTTNGSDVFLAKFNSNGNLSWSKTWGGTDGEYVTAIALSSDGGYVISGEITNSKSDVFLAKFNASGDSLWSKTWDGGSYEGIYDIKSTNDNGFILTGYSSSPSAGGYNYALLIKVTSGGDLSWVRTFGDESHNTESNRVIQSTDGGYVIAGNYAGFSTNSTDAFLAKFNADGEISWNKTWSSSSADDFGHGVTESSDNGYIVSGYTYGFGAGGSDVFISKLSSSGNLVWSKTWGSTSGEFSNDIVRMQDGSFVLVGNIEYSESNSDVLVTRFKADGTINTCSSDMCQSANPNSVVMSAVVSSPTGSVVSSTVETASLTMSSTTLNPAFTIILPRTPDPDPTITFSSQELYVTYPGESKTACKEWTAPNEKQIYGFYLNQATEKDYDFFKVSIGGTEIYNKSGTASNRYVDVSATPGASLSACVVADESTQDGFGGEITGIYYK